MDFDRAIFLVPKLRLFIFEDLNEMSESLTVEVFLLPCPKLNLYL